MAPKTRITGRRGNSTNGAARFLLLLQDFMLLCPSCVCPHVCLMSTGLCVTASLFAFAVTKPLFFLSVSDLMSQRPRLDIQVWGY